MQNVVLPGTGLSVSRFIFGTASLFNVGRRTARLNLLSAAADAGFTHFDTAPYYGFGLAERDLAPLLKERPDITISTKVGIYSPGGENQGDIAVFARKGAGRFIRAISRPEIDFSVSRARLALEGSLKRTGRGTIDLYLMHEPELGLLKSEEWLRFIENCRQTGKIRCCGLALTAEKLEPFLASGIMIGEVVQMLDSLTKQEADILARHNRPLQITYGYVSSALAEAPAVSVPDILKRALLRNRDGAVIVSSTKASRMATYAALADEVTD